MSEHNPPDSVYYEDMIDLRQLIKTLLKFKWIIIGATLIAALVAFFGSKFILSPKYEATALVGVTQSLFEVDLEPSINDPSPITTYQQLTEITKSLPGLAEADDVWLTVCTEMNIICQGDDNTKPELEAALVGTRHLELTVTSDDPGLSAEFANLWAEEVIYLWELIYGIGNLDLEKMESEVFQTLENWNTAQKSLEEYLPESKNYVIPVQLNQAQEELGRYLKEIEENKSIIRDADLLYSRLGEQTQTKTLLIGDALSLVGLLQRTTGEVSGTQFQISGTDIYGGGYLVSDARETLADLTSAIKSQNEELRDQLATLEAQITQLALEKETEQYQVTLLEQERNRALGYYQAQARYLDETRIVAKHGSRAAYCVAKAVVPLEGESNTLVATALAGLMGLMVSTGGVLIYQWWGNPRED